jgi:transposase
LTIAEPLASLLDNKQISSLNLQLSARIPVAEELRRDDEKLTNTYTSRTIQKRVKEVSGIKTCKAAIKEELPERIQKLRQAWCNTQLLKRPHRLNWCSVIFCDELHWCAGPRYAKYIKRRKNQRFRPDNVQYNAGGRPKNNSEKGQQQDEVCEQRFHIFTVLGFNFAWAIEYDAGNSNGKMNGQTFLQILPYLRDRILGRDTVLYMDRDSAHCSAEVLSWMDMNGMEYLIAPPASPDLSVMETWVKPLRQKFFRRRCTTARDGVKRFYEVWRELDPIKINRTILGYPARLYECRDVTKGRMTKY